MPSSEIFTLTFYLDFVFGGGGGGPISNPSVSRDPAIGPFKQTSQLASRSASRFRYYVYVWHPPLHKTAIATCYNSECVFSFHNSAAITGITWLQRKRVRWSLDSSMTIEK